nr:MAG TPA: hypothetical protein [Caudoviricetes sp.]
MRREVKVKTKMIVPLRLYKGSISLWLVSTANAREYDNIRVACWGC